MQIDFEVVAVRAIGIVLAMSPPGTTAARRERRGGIVAKEAICNQDPVGGLLRIGRDQQVDIAHIANAGIAEDGLRQRNPLEYSDRNPLLLQQIA